ncbi:MAG: VWA domain-containing protein [Colwellia sp.]
MTDFINNFHFLRPLWLFALIGLIVILFSLKKYRFNQSPWQQFLPEHLTKVLLESSNNTNNSNKKNKSANSNHYFYLLKPFIIGLLTIIALAGPAWEKLPQPVYQTERGSVLIMDMSYSMYSTDIKPNRLTRARFKAVDLLSNINEGDIGLVAYAGDAFIISPLTQDIKNIELLLPSLSPDIMPALGSNPLAALTLAHEMLINAGHLNGDIYWFTDDVDNEDLGDIYAWSDKFGHHLNILGIGTQAGAPITLPSGELLKDDWGAIVVPKLPNKKLAALSKRGQGSYQTISNDESDVNTLTYKSDLRKTSQDNKEQTSQIDQAGDQWQEQGPWLIAFIIPLLLSYFRRGSTIFIMPLLSLPLLLLLSSVIVSLPSYANDKETSSALNDTTNDSSDINTQAVEAAPSMLSATWNNLWQTKDQQAQKKYNQEDYQSAAQQFENAQWQGSAHYKAGNYQQALDAYKTNDSADALYNQGNALAQLQQYEQALTTYQKALEKNPDLTDAQENIEKIEELLKQQKEQEQQKQDGDDSQNKSEDQKQNDQQQSENGDQDKQSDQQDSKNDNQQQNSEKPNEQENAQQSDNKKQQEQEKQKEQQKQEEQAQQEQEKNNDEQAKDKKQGSAQITDQQQSKEEQQKHQQLLNMVTDDPYLLLRNKMQLEYQKRKQEGTRQGVKKKW